MAASVRNAPRVLLAVSPGVLSCRTVYPSITTHVRAGVRVPLCDVINLKHFSKNLFSIPSWPTHEVPEGTSMLPNLVHPNLAYIAVVVAVLVGDVVAVEVTEVVAVVVPVAVCVVVAVCVCVVVIVVEGHALHNDGHRARTLSLNGPLHAGCLNCFQQMICGWAQVGT